MLNLDVLSPSQREAVMLPDGPSSIIASPGSGKTTVITARTTYLLEHRQVMPESIIALTFSTKAAQEVRHRLEAIVGADGAMVEVSTFHAFGLRIIKQYAEALGYELGAPAVFGDRESALLLRDTLRRCGHNPEGFDLTELAKSIEIARLRHPEGLRGGQLRELISTYEELLLARNAVDYGSMICLPLRLFHEQPEVLGEYQAWYRYVLVDEFQDTSRAQYELVRALALRHSNLTIVGDTLQLLYSWRGADPELFERFHHDFPQARAVRLEENYRSTQLILELANAISRDLDPTRRMRTENPWGVQPGFYEAANPGDEAIFVAQTVLELLALGEIADPGRVAVLYRTREQAEPVIVALREARLPYYVRGGGDLFSYREIRDVLAYLRVIHNPNDGQALARIINTPPRKLDSIERVLQEEPIGRGGCLRLRTVGPRR